MGAVRFEDVRAAATDPQTFLSYEGIDIDNTAKDQSGPGFLPDIDNPRHDQIRRMIQPRLLPNRIAERENAVRAVVRGLIDVWRYRGTVDLRAGAGLADAQRGVLRPARPALGPCGCGRTRR